MKKFSLAFVFIVLIGLLAVFPIMQACDTGESGNLLVPQKMSRSQIIDEIKNQKNDGPYSGGAFTENQDVPQAAPGAEDSKNDYAKTNVQHEGIDEGDIIKVDSNYIYKLSAAGLVIVKIDNQMTVSCKIDYENFVPIELFILQDKLIVIGGVYETFNYGGSRSIGAVIDCCFISYQNTKIIIYDLNDRINLKLLNEYEISGAFDTSRLIEGKLYFTVSYYFYSYDEKTYFPKINSKEIDAKDISVYKSGYYYNYCIVGSINLETSSIEATAHLGLYGVNYFSKDNLFFFCTEYNNKQSGRYSTAYNYSTVIVKIELKTLNFSASARIDGLVADRYYADEFNDNLRVVSWSYGWRNYADGRWEDTSHTNVYVLDKNLNELGKITNIAPTERVYSVRFNGEQGSIVTFKQIDPLFKLDLKDPKNPKISDGLKEEGVSTYLQYLNNDTILGLGMNTKEENGFTRFAGMKVALYDNTGKDAVNVNTIELGTNGYAYSEALYNPKAILNDTAKNMFSFALNLWEYGPDWNYEKVTQGLAVFEYDLNAKINADKLIFRGILSNIEAKNSYENWYDYYDNYTSYVTRGARIGNKIYTISDKYITSYDIETLKLSQRLQIAEFKPASELFELK